jgi:hypothetical protein
MHTAKLSAVLVVLSFAFPAAAPAPAPAPAHAQSRATPVHVAAIAGHATAAPTLRRLLRERIDGEPTLVETDRRRARMVVRGTVECTRRRASRRDHEVRCEVSWIITTGAAEEMRVLVHSTGTARGPRTSALEETALAATTRSVLMPLRAH